MNFKKLAPLAIVVSLALCLSAMAAAECDIALSGGNKCYISYDFTACPSSDGKGYGSCSTSCLMLTGGKDTAGMHGDGSCYFQNPIANYLPPINCSFDCSLSGANAISCSADCEPSNVGLSHADEILRPYKSQ